MGVSKCGLFSVGSTIKPLLAYSIIEYLPCKGEPSDLASYLICYSLIDRV